MQDVFDDVDSLFVEETAHAYLRREHRMSDREWRKVRPFFREFNDDRPFPLKSQGAIDMNELSLALYRLTGKSISWLRPVSLQTLQSRPHWMNREKWNKAIGVNVWRTADAFFPSPRNLGGMSYEEMYCLFEDHPISFLGWYLDEEGGLGGGLEEMAECALSALLRMYIGYFGDECVMDDVLYVLKSGCIPLGQTWPDNEYWYVVTK